MEKSAIVGFRGTAFRDHLVTGRIRPVTVIGRYDVDQDFVIKASIAFLVAALILTVLL